MDLQTAAILSHHEIFLFSSHFNFAIYVVGLPPIRLIFICLLFTSNSCFCFNFFFSFFVVNSLFAPFLRLFFAMSFYVLTMEPHTHTYTCTHTNLFKFLRFNYSNFFLFYKLALIEKRNKIYLSFRCHTFVA